MLPAAIGHWHAFSYRDYVVHGLSGRLPLYYAFRDAIGLVDVWQDTLNTIAGKNFNYYDFEPADGVPAFWQRRIRTGLRYSQGGRGKYWVQKPYPTQHVWDEDEEQGLLGFAAVREDADMERLYAEARMMMYGDDNSPVLSDLQVLETARRPSRHRSKRPRRSSERQPLLANASSSASSSSYPYTMPGIDDGGYIWQDVASQRRI
jgi:hypothetical protein